MMRLEAISFLLGALVLAWQVAGDQDTFPARHLEGAMEILALKSCK